MALDVFGPVEAETIERFALDELVDEVGGLDRPAVRNVFSADLDLTSQDLLLDLEPVAAVIRSAPKHALVTNDADGKVVDSHAMGLSAHHLGRHVPRRAGSILLVLGVPLSHNAEVGDLEVPALVEDQVFRLDIAVQNALLVQVL